MHKIGASDCFHGVGGKGFLFYQDRFGHSFRWFFLFLSMKVCFLWSCSPVCSAVFLYKMLRFFYFYAVFRNIYAPKDSVLPVAEDRCRHRIGDFCSILSAMLSGSFLLFLRLFFGIRTVCTRCFGSILFLPVFMFFSKSRKIFAFFDYFWGYFS